MISHVLCELNFLILIGCGGYVNGEGVASSPNYLTDDDDIDECYWFVEARKNDGIVCLKRNGMKDLVYNSQLPIMTVCHYIVLFKISGYFINCILFVYLLKGLRRLEHIGQCALLR